MNDTPDQRFPCPPGPHDREPTEAEIEAVSASILAHLSQSATEWHEALSDAISLGTPAGLGEALRDGRISKVGMLAHKAAVEKLTEDATDLANDWLADDLTTNAKIRLAQWRPVRFATLGREYHLREMMG